MIVDNDRSRKAGRVMTLGGDEVGTSDRGKGDTVPYRAVYPVRSTPAQRTTESNSSGNGGDYKPWSTTDEDENGGPIIPDTEPDPGPLPKPWRAVSFEASGHETGTYALAAIKRQTGKPSKNEMAHRTAQRIQNGFNAANWNVAIWYGEYTEEFWVMDEAGLHGGFKTVTELYQGMGWQSL